MAKRRLCSGDLGIGQIEACLCGFKFVLCVIEIFFWNDALTELHVRALKIRLRLIEVYF